MRKRNLKHLFLVLTAILLVGLISLTGCNGTDEASSGTGSGGGTASAGTGGGSSSTSQPSGDSDSFIRVTTDQLASEYNNYVGKNVVFSAIVDSNTNSYIMIGSIKIEPQDPTSLGGINAGDEVEVKGLVQGLSGGVVVVTNGQIMLLSCAE